MRCCSSGLLDIIRKRSGMRFCQSPLGADDPSRVLIALRTAAAGSFTAMLASVVITLADLGRSFHSRKNETAATRAL
jgi:hypothetical protein